jgi:hypothetical protein
MHKILLDAEFEYLRPLIRDKLNTYGYALVKVPKAQRGSSFLHHCIVGQPLARKIEVVDHINCDKLDNRRENLRIVSRRLNVLSTNSTWGKEERLGRGYAYDTNSKRYYLHSEFAPYFSHKSELVIARLFEYFALKEDSHYPCKFERLTEAEAKALLKNRKTKSVAGTRILVTYEETLQRGERAGLSRYRFDYFIEGKKTRSRLVGTNTEIRIEAYKLLKLSKAQAIVYNWKR